MRFFLFEPPCGGGLQSWSFAPERTPEGAFNEIYSTENSQEPKIVTQPVDFEGGQPRFGVLRCFQWN
jgi:hypothetical protein